MNRAPTKSKKLIELVQGTGLIRPRDLARHGIKRSQVQRLCDDGLLVRAGRGIYYSAEADLTEHHTLAEACKRVPHGVICLASALHFHNLTTQNPWQIWLMIETGRRVPQVDYPPLRVFQAKRGTLYVGTEEHVIEGVLVRVTSPARTVVDCFKYRNKIGLDVALEALAECLRERRCSRDEIQFYARIGRVENVMRPYTQALTRG
jgi:predicted transcriptional regulator of viral defense system